MPMIGLNVKNTKMKENRLRPQGLGLWGKEKHQTDSILLIKCTHWLPH